MTQEPVDWIKTDELEQSRQGGLLHGVSRWFSQGRLLSERWFWKGLATGSAKSYYLSGALYRLEHFHLGQREGIQEAYYENGQVKTREVYSQGVREGEALLFWPSGQLKRKILFSQGKVIRDELLDERGKPYG